MDLSGSIRSRSEPCAVRAGKSFPDELPLANGEITELKGGQSCLLLLICLPAG